MHHNDTAARVIAERAVSVKLQGGCQVPIASFAQLENDEITLRALVGTVDGTRIIRSELTGNSHAAEQLGITAAEDLLSRGAAEILDELRAAEN